MIRHRERDDPNAPLSSTITETPSLVSQAGEMSGERSE